VKPNDQGGEREIQKPVDKGPRLSLTADEDEEACPCPRLDDMREPDHSKENDGRDLKRRLHLALATAALAPVFLKSRGAFRSSMSVERAE
jgi:hypothetical protein